MTKKESKNSADNDNQEIDTTFRTGFYGSMVNPRYTSTISDSGAALTADMLTRAAEKARTMGYYGNHPTGLMSAHALKYLQEEQEKMEQMKKFHSSPVGELLK
jgi:xanthine/uracil/vitamin C permease (AzgA family)